MRGYWKVGIGIAILSLVSVFGLRISVQLKNPSASAESNLVKQTPPANVPKELANAGVANFVKKGDTQKLMGLDRTGKFSVSFGPAPDYFLTLTPSGGQGKVIARLPTMAAMPVPGSGKVTFSSLGNNQVPYPVYIVNQDGSELTQIGTTETPWRLQTTSQGLVAFREGSSLTVYDIKTGTKTPLPGISLKGQYGIDDTLWTISADGTKVALRDGDALTLYDLATGKSRQAKGMLDRRRETVGAWSPDGTLFAYSTEPRSPEETSKVWVTSPDSEERLVFEFPEKAKGMFWRMAWLDNKAFVVNHVPGGPYAAAISKTQYFLVNSTGGGKLLFTNGANLAVSDDGKRLFVERQTVVDSLEGFSVWQADVIR